MLDLAWGLEDTSFMLPDQGVSRIEDATLADPRGPYYPLSRRFRPSRTPALNPAGLSPVVALPSVWVQTKFAIFPVLAAQLYKARNGRAPGTPRGKARGKASGMAAQHGGQPPKNSHRAKGTSPSRERRRTGQTSGRAHCLPAVRRAADDAADVVATTDKSNPADHVRSPLPLPRGSGASEAVERGPSAASGARYTSGTSRRTRPRKTSYERLKAVKHTVSSAP